MRLATDTDPSRGWLATELQIKTSNAAGRNDLADLPIVAIHLLDKQLQGDLSTPGFGLRRKPEPGHR